MPRDEEFLSTLAVDLMPPGFDPGGFDCGEADLTDYLCDGDAARDSLAGVSQTHLVDADGEFIAYFSVLADAIRLQGSEKPDGVVYPTAPALKLGRMGVDSAYQGRGVGQWILDFVVGMARTAASRFGMRYVTLDAFDESLVEWYAVYGFVKNHAEEVSEIAWREHHGRWSEGEQLLRTSMRFDIQLHETVT